ncbi:MAG TPA: tetratricopeptide repeat protein [Blastocatellia bacterium]|nr:tetratricopeptide repeat protein [Blastocatellia bacterium]
MLVFDTLEKAGGSAIRFLTQTAPHLKEVNSNTYILAAGRQIPAELVDSKYVEKLPLGGLNENDFSRFFSETVNGRSIPEEIARRVHTVSKGRPIWAGLFADWTNAGNDPVSIDTSGFEKFREQVLQPVSNLREPEDTLILAMAHLSRRCNESLLSHVLSGVTDKLGIDIPKQVKKLARFTFVKYIEPIGDDVGSCLLHDEMRDLVHDHLWRILDTSGRQRKEWSRKAVTFYDREIRRAEAKAQPVALDLQELNAERLYYLFHVNPVEAFDCYQRLFTEARSTDVLEELNEEIAVAQRDFGEELPQPLKRRYLLKLADVDMHRERYARAIERFTALSEDVDCEVEILANARWRLMMVYNLHGEFQRSVARGDEWKVWLESRLHNLQPGDDAYKALNLELASLYSQLGYSYRLQSIPSEAAGHYNKALELYHRFGASRDLIANTRTNLAAAYLQLGQSTKALEQCKAAYHAYLPIGDPYHLGRVHNVWGLIHDGFIQEDAALEQYNKAIQFFQEARSKRGQGMSQVAQARMLRRQHWHKHRKSAIPPEETERTFKKIGELIDAAIANLESGDPVLRATAIGEKGALLRAQGRFDEAVVLFRESNKIARKIKHNHQIADTLQSMARALYHKGDFETAIELAEEAISYEVPRPSGRARRTIADIHFRRKNYEGAFEEISRSCSEIVQMDTGSLGDSPARRDQVYGEWIDWVKRLLLELPTAEERQARTRQLIDRWNGLEVDGEPLGMLHPEFVSVLENLEYNSLDR